MGLLVWSHGRIALWHFTIFLPDHFVGHRRRVRRLGDRLGDLRADHPWGHDPRQNETDLLTAIESVPGAVLGMAAAWFIGVRQNGATSTITTTRDAAAVPGRDLDAVRR